MEDLVFARLIGAFEVAAQVGTRVYPLVFPQAGELPAVVYRRISSDQAHTHDQAGGLVEVRLQVDCLAAGFAEGRALATAVDSALNGWTDRNEGILACLLINQFDLYEDTTGVYRAVLEFMIKERI